MSMKLLEKLRSKNTNFLLELLGIQVIENKDKYKN